ncbi:MAG: helix-turn-helix domain-containing protein [Alistipes sp.]|nr:helix-turn-helix domain-containing protein [Rikenellaceae bacterium]MCD8073112.1 helix-turn-helix domain-containing protein [Alistipes sp.]
MDTEDVCNALKVSKRSLLYHRNTGKIPFTYIGSKVYYKAEDIQKLLFSGIIKI